MRISAVLNHSVYRRYRSLAVDFYLSTNNGAKTMTAYIDYDNANNCHLLRDEDTDRVQLSHSNLATLQDMASRLDIDIIN